MDANLEPALPLSTPPRRAPDLLFEDEQEARVAELAPLLEQPERLDAQVALHRVTVFLTYRCNLACPYCKTIARSPAELARFPQKRFTHDLASFAQLLDSHRGTPLRHLHFTGGEAAMVPAWPRWSLWRSGAASRQSASPPTGRWRPPSTSS